MSTQLSTNRTEEGNDHEKRLTPNGTLFEFLASPDDTGAETCLIRGTIPPGVAVPLHSHPEVEIFYVLEGTIEAFRSSNDSHGWTSVGARSVVTIPGNTKHALRNGSPVAVTMVVVTTSKLYRFFQEVTKPFDPNQSVTPPTHEEIEALLRIAAKYGYWMGSPEENAAIGLSLK